MGEAKRKREQQRQQILAEMERWEFPATEAEAKATAEIAQLPILDVRRLPAAQLAYMNMPPQKCHANARWMAENDPENKSEQITGWWPQHGNYVLHSVIKRDGELLCVTPTPTYRGEFFPFIPDPDIEWRREGDVNEAYRKGLNIGPGLRSEPEENTRIIKIVRDRILAGIDPWKAGEPPFD